MDCSIYNSFYNQQYSQMNSNQQAGTSFYLKDYSQSPQYNKSANCQDTSLTNSSVSCNSSTTLNSSLNSSLTNSNNEFSTQFSTPLSTSSFSSTYNNSANFALYSNHSSPSNYDFSPISNYYYNYFPHSYHNQILSYPNYNASSSANKNEQNYATKTVKHSDSISLEVPQIEKVETSYLDNNRLINKAYNNEQKRTSNMPSNEACQRRKRRQRTQFNNYQLAELEKLFQTTRYPDIDCREDLSAKIGIPEPRIQVWFKNRRSKVRNGKSDSKQSTCDYLECINNEDDEVEACF